jgi:D-alanyl-D-alanine carboxypeptidase
VRHRAAVAAAFAAGAVAGAALILSLPVPGMPPGPSDPMPPAPRVLGRAPVSTLLAWTPGSLPAGYARAVRALPTVRAATAVSSGVVWVDRWRNGDGRVGRPPRGFRIPVEVASVRPKTYAPFVPPSEREAILDRNSALIGATFAEMHGLGSRSVLRAGATSLRINGAIDDPLIGAHEVVVPATIGDRLGIVRSRYLLVAPRPGAADRVEAALRRLVPPGVRVRVRSPGETPVFRHGDAVLPQVRLKELFGEFSAREVGGGLLELHPSWVRTNIENARVPVLGRIRCHRLVIPLIRAALEDLTRRGLGRLVDPADYGGCYYPRYIARDSGTGLSHHTWGIAIDINVSQGLPGRQPTIDPRVVEAFEAQGFKWGGEFLVPDGTHFELVRFPV